MSNLKIFEDKQIRTTWSETEGKWYFVVEKDGYNLYLPSAMNKPAFAKPLK